MAKKSIPPGATVVYVKEKHGCLMTAAVFLLFGWLGLLVMGCWKLTKLAWRWTITVGIKWPVRAGVASWAAFVALCVWSWKGSRAATIWGVAQVRAIAAKRSVSGPS